MSGSFVYNSIENVLLFQSLCAQGFSEPVFLHTSERLKNDIDVQSSSDFDADRLAPQALKDHFIRIIQDEAKISTQDIPNGVPSSRKKNVLSPAFASLEDVSKIIHRMPKILLKLLLKFYIQFREHVILDLRQLEKIQSQTFPNHTDKGCDHLTEANESNENNAIIGNLQNRTLAHLGHPADDSSIRPTTGTIEFSQTAPKTPLAQPITHQSTTFLPPSYSHPSQPPYAQTPYLIPPVYQPHNSPQASPSPVNLHPNAKPYKKPKTPLLAPSHTTSAQNTRLPPHPISSRPPGGSTSMRPMTSTPLANGGFVLQPFQVSPQIPSSIIRQQVPLLSVSSLSHSASSPQPHHHQQPQPQPHFARFHPRLGTASPQSSPLSASTPSPMTPVTPQVAQIISVSQSLADPNLMNKPPPILQSDAVSHSVVSPMHVRAGSPINEPAPLAPPAPAPATEPAADPAAEPVTNTRADAIPLEPPMNEPVEKTMARLVGESVTELELESNKLPVPSIQKLKAETSIAGWRGSRSTRKLRGISSPPCHIEIPARGKTRSQSVLSPVSTDALADDTADETVVDNVKTETLSTLGSEIHADESPEPAQSRRTMTRHSKRKRSVAISVSTDSEVVDTEAMEAKAVAEDEIRPTQDKTVLAVRNFPRVSGTVWSTITGHTHAGLFSKHISERDAQGYTSITRRPTNLKLIKAAIVAGGQAIKIYETANAALSGLGTSVSSRDATMLYLPWSQDLVPPKAIVNSAQLEKELMRMFANAVMFNPGDDEIVEDAREMYEFVQKEILQFQEAKKGAEKGPIIRPSWGVVEDDDELESIATTPVQFSINK